MKTRLGLLSATALCTALMAGGAMAAPVNGTGGNLSSNVIYGGGNDNGSFTGTTFNNLELALRAHLRYDNTSTCGGVGCPQSTYHYDGDHTYTFNPAEGNAPANRSIFNFDWSVNTDTADTTGTPSSVFSDYLFSIALDTDPGAGTNFLNLPLSVGGDHSFGFNTTPMSGGFEAPGDGAFAALAGTYNVAQNSWNLGFFTNTSYFSPAIGNPQAPGTYTVTLSAYDLNSSFIGSTSIDVVVGAVPLPAGLPLLMSAFGGLALLRRKRKAA